VVLQAQDKLDAARSELRAAETEAQGDLVHEVGEISARSRTAARH